MSFAYLEFLLANALDCDFVFFGAAALPLAAFLGVAALPLAAFLGVAALPLAAFLGVAALPLADFAGSETDEFFFALPAVAELGAERVMTIDFSETEILPFCSTTTT